MLLDESGEMPIIDSSNYYLIPDILMNRSWIQQLIYGKPTR